MQTTNYSLHELLRLAKEEKLTIPQFQRRFVWRDSQTKLLIDSMSRSYPIGSLLLLDKDPKLQLASRSIQVEIRENILGCDENEKEHEKKDESYILDGQQRITSITRAFLDAHPSKAYYVDLKLILEQHDAEETSWIKVRRRGKKAPERRDNNKLVRADVILDQTKMDIYVTEYIEDSGDFPQFVNDKMKGRQAAARIKGVFETIRNYKIPVVTLERNSGIESICRVFETINSTGTRLTTFDLAVARFYPRPDLSSLWETAQDDHAILKNFDVDGERVLQVLYLVVSAKERYPEPTRSNLLALDRDEIEREWKKSARAVAETYEWAQAHGARPETLPSHTVLVALAAVRRLFSQDVSEAPWKDHDFLRRWYFSKILQAGASQASNYRVAQDFRTLYRYLKHGDRPDIPEVRLDSSTILDIRPSDVRYKALQNVFATTIHQDLATGELIGSASNLHDHHIFPKNANRRHGLRRNMLDGICNRLPLLAKSNWSLNEAYPDEYLSKIAADARQQGTLGGLAARLRDCMIPGHPDDEGWKESFSLNSFEDFCRRRADLIIERVREVVGDSLKEVSVNEDADDG